MIKSKSKLIAIILELILKEKLEVLINSSLTYEYESSTISQDLSLTYELIEP